MTSFYMASRLWFKTFFGEQRVDPTRTHITAFTSRPGSCCCAVVLALLSVALGGMDRHSRRAGRKQRIEGFLGPVFANGAAGEAVALTTGHGLELALAAISVLVALAGFYIAYVFYCEKPGTAAALARNATGARNNLVKNSTGGRVLQRISD